MNDLHHWLVTQHAGLRTYKTFRERALSLRVTDARHAALYSLLANLAGNYVASFDEAPLPVETAERAFHQFRDLVAAAQRSMDESAELQLAVLNDIAAVELA